MPTSGYLVVDIETVPDPELYDRPELQNGVAPPFPPLYVHKLVVLGALWLGDDYRLKKLGVLGEDKDEAGTLAAFSDFVGGRHPQLVTYNGRCFDLPVIALRSLRHGVPMPWYYQGKVRNRYTEDGHLDLCDMLTDHGAARSMSLDAVARLVGLPGKVGVDGSQVEGLWNAGQVDAVRNYCLADVAQTALVFLRFRLIQGLISPTQYRELAGELVAAFRADARLAPLTAGMIDERVLLDAPRAATSADEAAA